MQVRTSKRFGTVLESKAAAVKKQQPSASFHDARKASPSRDGKLLDTAPLMAPRVDVQKEQQTLGTKKNDVPEKANKANETSTVQSSGSLVDRAEICACNNGTETSLNVCFDQVAKSFQKKFSTYGRTLNLPQDKLSLDFELETTAQLDMTPDLLLARAGHHIAPDIFLNVSQWFQVDFDGTGLGPAHDGYKQGFTAVLELESVPMKVEEVRGSSFLGDLQHFLAAMNKSSEDATSQNRIAVPGSTNLFFHNHVGDNLQYTIGLPLAWVTTLLTKSDSARWQGVMQRLNHLHCPDCSAEYRSLVALAAGTLQQAKQCKVCIQAKRCMFPWLVRTHFGDLVKHVRQSLGEGTSDRFSQFPEDVLEVADVKPDEVIFPNGITDYLKFSELAEIGGLVVPRSSMLGVSQDANVSRSQVSCLPTTRSGIQHLAQQMLKNREQVEKRMQSRGCNIYGLEDRTLTSFSAQTWLQEMLKGRDVMSDSDSPITQQSFSKLVWKSMGSWRMDMSAGGGKVYLECRSRSCLGKHKKDSLPHDYVPYIREIAEKMQAFEREMAGES